MGYITNLLPSRLWPNRSQYALLGGLLAGVLAICSGIVYHAWQAEHDQQTLHDKTQTVYTQLRTQAIKDVSDISKPTTSQLPPLPSASAIDNVIRDMTGAAQHLNIPLSSVTIDATHATAQELAQRQITVQAKGDYNQLKNWTGDMLARVAQDEGKAKKDRNT